jgi:hypothetical protein
MIFVEDIDSLQALKVKWLSEDCVIYPQWSDNKLHFSENRLSFIVFYFNQSSQYYIVNINHTDCLGMKIEGLDFLNEKQIGNLNRIIYWFKEFSQLYDIDNGIDADILHMCSFGKVAEEYQIPKPYYKDLVNINDSVPISKQLEQIKSLMQIYHTCTTWKTFISVKEFSKYVKAFGEIEKNGIYVDEEISQQREGKRNQDGLVFSSYNFLTSTLRPSNTFGGTNFSALNKNTGIRKHFTSRYGNDGRILNIDFVSYHPRILANIFVDLFKKHPNRFSSHYSTIDENTNIYNWIQSQSIALNDITYDEMKVLTFQQIYGGIDAEMKEIPFFNDIALFTEKLLENIDGRGIVESRIFKLPLRVVEFGKAISGTKAFNYYIQALETEINVEKIKKVVELLRGKKTKLILYTYDALTFDIYKEETYLLKEIESILKEGAYPIKVTIGKNYQEQNELNTRKS